MKKIEGKGRGWGGGGGGGGMSPFLSFIPGLTKLCIITLTCLQK